MEVNPREVFLRLFGAADSAATSKETASLLDHIVEQTRALQRDLGPSDCAVLDSHQTAVREVEQHLSAGRDLRNTALPPMPKGVPDSFEE